MVDFVDDSQQQKGGNTPAERSAGGTGIKMNPNAARDAINSVSNTIRKNGGLWGLVEGVLGIKKDEPKATAPAPVEMRTPRAVTPAELDVQRKVAAEDKAKSYREEMTNKNGQSNARPIGEKVVSPPAAATPAPAAQASGIGGMINGVVETVKKAVTSAPEDMGTHAARNRIEGGLQTPAPVEDRNPTAVKAPEPEKAPAAAAAPKAETAKLPPGPPVVPEAPAPIDVSWPGPRDGDLWVTTLSGSFKTAATAKKPEFQYAPASEIKVDHGSVINRDQERTRERAIAWVQEQERTAAARVATSPTGPGGLG